MNEMTAGMLRKNFSKVLNDVQNGEKYRVLYGKQGRAVAYIVPATEEEKRGIRSFGGSFSFSESDGKITEENFLGL